MPGAVFRDGADIIDSAGSALPSERWLWPPLFLLAVPGNFIVEKSHCACIPSQGNTILPT